MAAVDRRALAAEALRFARMPGSGAEGLAALFDVVANDALEAAALAIEKTAESPEHAAEIVRDMKEPAGEPSRASATSKVDEVELERQRCLGWLYEYGRNDEQDDWLEAGLRSGAPAPGPEPSPTPATSAAPGAVTPAKGEG